MAQNHTCCGVPYYREAGNKFRQYVKDEVQKGQTNYKAILQHSGVKRSMRQMRGLYLGDGKIRKCNVKG